MYRPKGLNRDYSKNFMKDVDMQGTGIDTSKQYIKLINSTRTPFEYSYVSGVIGKSGVILIPNKSVAVDTSIIALGTELCIDSFGEKIAHDTGGKIKGNSIDIFVDWTRQDAMNFGVKHSTVYKKKGGKKQ